MLTTLQEATIKSILNIFETSQVRGDYASITLIPGDTGGLTYGRSQTTLNGGGLFSLVTDYVADPARPYAGPLSAYLPGLKVKKAALNTDVYLCNLLRATADYPVMRDIQDVFFDRFYWGPAAATAAGLGIQTALGVGAVYDGSVHGSFKLIRDRATAKVGSVAKAGEKKWVTTYVNERYDWLSTHPRADLRATTYRMETFKALVAHGAWDLALPLVIRGVTISPQTLSAQPPRVFDGPPVGSRDLAVGSGVMSGRDVRAVQVALTAPALGERLAADGHYGGASQAAVQRLQAKNSLPKTGVADGKVFKLLGL